MHLKLYYNNTRYFYEKEWILRLEKIKRLYLKYEELVNYIIVGVLTTIVSLVFYYASTRTFLDVNDAIELQIANLIKWTSGVIFAYFTNRKYVFKSTNPNYLKEFFSFSSSRVATLFLDMALMWLFVTNFMMQDLIAALISIAIVTVANYFLSKIFVFKNKD